jgi:hypothetical protein
MSGTPSLNRRHTSRKALPALGILLKTNSFLVEGGRGGGLARPAARSQIREFKPRLTKSKELFRDV